jgi:hypothetical protein
LSSREQALGMVVNVLQPVCRRVVNNGRTSIFVEFAVKVPRNQLAQPHRRGLGGGRLARGKEAHAAASPYPAARMDPKPANGGRLPTALKADWRHADRRKLQAVAWSETPGNCLFSGGFGWCAYRASSTTVIAVDCNLQCRFCYCRRPHERLHHRAVAVRCQGWRSPIRGRPLGGVKVGCFVKPFAAGEIWRWGQQ